MPKLAANKKLKSPFSKFCHIYQEIANQVHHCLAITLDLQKFAGIFWTAYIQRSYPQDPFNQTLEKLDQKVAAG